MSAPTMAAAGPAPKFRYLAPAGAPIGPRDLARWAVAALRPDPPAALASALCDRFGIRHACLFSTGRAALTVALRAMRSLAPGRDEVVLPSYTCYSVAASVVKAGLRPRLVDIIPETLDLDVAAVQRLNLRRALAIVPTNLYGLPNDLRSIGEIASANGVFVVDDAAQAMGATVQGRLCGTRGDVGLFSFDKGKNVSAIDGGVLVTDRDDLAAALRQELDALPAARLSTSIDGVVKALAYAALLHPSRYWIPARIPQLGLGATKFTTEFPLERACRSLTALARPMVDRLDELNRIRTANAARLIDALAGVPGVTPIVPIPGAAPVYLRLPLLVASPQVRGRLLQVLPAAGIGATGSYPTALGDIPELRPELAGPTTTAPGGRYVAERIVTLPTHTYVTAADIARMARTIAETVADDDGREAAALEREPETWPAPIAKV